MTLPLLLLLFLTAAGLALAVAGYLRWEPVVKGRGGLLGLRIASLGLLLLLLLNPALPGEDDGPRSDVVRWVVLDAGPALDVPVPDAEGDPDATLRGRVVERALEEARGGARLAFAGPEPEGVDTLTLREAGARPPLVDLRPSLLRLAEAGADSILVLSPFRTSYGALERATARLPIAVRTEQMGAHVRNAGVLELDLPRRVPAGEPVEGILSIFGEGGGEADSVGIEIAADGVMIERRRVPLPPAGSPLRLPLELPPLPDTGVVRYTARVDLDGDDFSADDERVRWIRVGPPEGGIILVSLLPDWEPRVLLPILEAATGLPGEGYLRMAGGERWLPLGRGEDPASPVGEEAFRDRLGTAALLVVHAAGEEVPAWLAAAAGAHPRVIHLPAGPAGSRLAGLSPAGARGGEWSPDPELPPSPVAPYLAGITLGDLPPLGDLRPPGEDRGAVVLRVRAQRGGETLPALILRDVAEGRRAVALATGFWRWGNRSGTPREVYRGLWSGVAGWLLASDAVAGLRAIRPIEPVVARDESFEWVAPEGANGTLTLRFVPVEAGEGAADDPDDPDDPDDQLEGLVTRVVELDRTGRGRSEPLTPGLWRWEGTVEGGAAEGRAGDDAVSGSGTVEVEHWSGALSVPPLDSLPAPSEADPGTAGVRRDDPTRPLRTHPLPYLLLLGLLCVEWIARRRVGLR